jgi:hypothetical protein
VISVILAALVDASFTHWFAYRSIQYHRLILDFNTLLSHL